MKIDALQLADLKNLLSCIVLLRDTRSPHPLPCGYQPWHFYAHRLAEIIEAAEAENNLAPSTFIHQRPLDP